MVSLLHIGVSPFALSRHSPLFFYSSGSCSDKNSGWVALERRNGLRQDLFECHNRPSTYLGTVGTLLREPILPEDLVRHHAWQKRKDVQGLQHSQRL
jgi:hypothetical protein